MSLPLIPSLPPASLAPVGPPPHCMTSSDFLVRLGLFWPQSPDSGDAMPEVSLVLRVPFSRPPDYGGPPMQGDILAVRECNLLDFRVPAAMTVFQLEYQLEVAVADPDVAGCLHFVRHEVEPGTTHDMFHDASTGDDAEASTTTTTRPAEDYLSFNGMLAWSGLLWIFDGSDTFAMARMVLSLDFRHPGCHMVDSRELFHLGYFKIPIGTTARMLADILAHDWRECNSDSLQLLQPHIQLKIVRESDVDPVFPAGSVSEIEQFATESPWRFQ